MLVFGRLFRLGLVAWLLEFLVVSVGLSMPRSLVHFVLCAQLVDYVSLGTMRFLRLFTHAWFATAFDHHALVLETVAAVPGIVAAMHRHLRSLRKMERDHGWVSFFFFLRVSAGWRRREDGGLPFRLLLSMSCPLLVMCFFSTIPVVIFVFPSRHTQIGTLEEEAENERMHLLIWMKVCQPSTIDRVLVVIAQVARRRLAPRVNEYGSFFVAVSLF